ETLTGYHVVETIAIGPFEKDHAAIVIQPGKAQRREPEREAPREERPRFERRDERPREDRPRFDKPKFGPKAGGKPHFEKREPRSFDKPKFDKPKRSGSEWKQKPARRGWK